MYPVELIGPRVKVREFTLADLNDIYEYAHDEEATRFMTWPAPKVPEDSLPFLREAISFQAAEERLNYEMAIELDGRAVGGIGFRINPRLTSEAEMGYVLHPDLWGQGLTTEAAKLLINWGFDVIKVHRIAAFHDVDNIASGRVMEKVGMQYEGRMRGHLKNRQGEWRESDLRSIITDDRKSIGTNAEYL